MLQRIGACPKPTIARVHGVAIGGGVGLACACDFALASDDTRFAVTEARVGLAASVIGPYLIPAVGLRISPLLTFANQTSHPIASTKAPVRL